MSGELVQIADRNAMEFVSGHRGFRQVAILHVREVLAFVHEIQDKETLRKMPNDWRVVVA